MIVKILFIIAYLIPIIGINVCFKFRSKLLFIWFDILLLVPLFNYLIMFYLAIDAESHAYVDKPNCIFRHNILEIISKLEDSEFIKWLIKEEW